MKRSIVLDHLLIYSLLPITASAATATCVASIHSPGLLLLPGHGIIWTYGQDMLLFTGFVARV